VSEKDTFSSCLINTAEMVRFFENHNPNNGFFHDKVGKLFRFTQDRPGDQFRSARDQER